MTQIFLFLGISDDVFGSLPQLQSPPDTFQFRIFVTNENRHLTLNFPATKTILEVKNDLYAVLKIPVRFQQWKGWPDVPVTSKLSEAGIEPIHNLELTRIGDTVGSSSSSNMPVDIDDDSDSPDENFVDALNADDEDMFAEPSHGNRLKLLSKFLKQFLELKLMKKFFS